MEGNMELEFILDLKELKGKVNGMMGKGLDGNFFFFLILFFFFLIYIYIFF